MVTNKSKVTKLAGPAEPTVVRFPPSAISIDAPLNEESLSGFDQATSERNISSSNIASSGSSSNQLEVNMSKCISECDSTTDYDQDLSTNCSTPVCNAQPSTSGAGGVEIVVQPGIASEVDSTTDVSTSDEGISQDQKSTLQPSSTSCMTNVDV